MAGTDAGASYAYLLPGFALHEELALLVEAGFTPLQALEAATLNAAKFLRQEDSFGTVEKNKTADLVLLTANPLDNIRNTSRIRVVILGGKCLAREDLDALLERAESTSRADSQK